MLTVSICMLSVTLNVFCRKFDLGEVEIGFCALQQSENRTDRKINDIGRKPLNSSEFMLKSQNSAFYCAKITGTIYFSKKGQIWREYVWKRDFNCGRNPIFPEHFINTKIRSPEAEIAGKSNSA